MRSLLIVLLLLLCFKGQAQKFKTDLIQDDEVRMTTDPDFPDASAVILFKEVITSVTSHVEVYQRIKILNEDGLDYGTISIPYPEPYKIRGKIHNWNGTAVETIELEKEFIFEEEVIDGVEFVTLTFPKVQSGSVIELSYRSKYGTTADIDLQHDIPVKRIRVEAVNGSGAKLKLVQNPMAYVRTKRTNNDNATVIKAENLPALEYESHVYNMELYRAKLKFVFTGYVRYSGNFTWNGIVRNLYKDHGFNPHLRPNRVYQETLTELLGNEKDTLAQAKLVYDYVQSTINWNDYIGYYPDNGTRKTFKDQEGDLADINILLVSMLRSLGITAYPVVTSTKNNGLHITPSPEAFNYLIACAEINGEKHLLDAANEEASFEFLPEVLLNGWGRAVDEDRIGSTIDLTHPKTSSETLLIKASLDDDLVVSGQVDGRCTGYLAFSLNQYIEDRGEISIENLVDFDRGDVEAHDLEFDANEVAYDLTSFKYQFEMEDLVETIGQEVYISPFLFFDLQQNPFDAEERRFPIDFGFPKKLTRRVTITIPEGYKVKSVPDAVRFKMNNDRGAYYFQAQEYANTLQIVFTHEIRNSMIPTLEYPDLQEFYNRRMAVEDQRIVLIKTQ
ncbi:transglutaminase domain-containing protein [Aureitalea marina]|uniref:DUF3857 domain-containing protein n=1 Tax=Aureitalea marina TaxID=930804 RepID=A0A2S7KM07_9FLAO|nr:DUF3857 domain-containing protein [Aureitalea marina]PQB03657.1 hypothetical protein BST85_01130 [Aureitalea marina]